MPATLMIKLALACALAATAARAASLQASHTRGVAAGFCAELNPDLPNFCSCNDLDDGAKVGGPVGPALRGMSRSRRRCLCLALFFCLFWEARGSLEATVSVRAVAVAFGRAANDPTQRR